MPEQGAKTRFGREYHRQWYQKNKAKLRAKALVYYYKRREAYVAKYNTPEYREYTRNYRRRRRTVDGGYHPECAAGRKYYARNREKILQRQKPKRKKFYAANRERLLAVSRRYARLHRAEKAARNAAWRHAHPENIRRLGIRRRARELNAPGTTTPQQIAARVDFYGNRCAYCDGPYEHLDHVIPLARGGSNWPANLRPACARCNLEKQARKLSEWRHSA